MKTDWQILESRHLALIAAAADELAARMRQGETDLGIWAVPPDHAAQRNGFLYIGRECPYFPAAYVRPADNHASTFQRWAAVPYSALRQILTTACRVQPLVPIYPESDCQMDGSGEAMPHGGRCPLVADAPSLVGDAPLCAMPL